MYDYEEMDLSYEEMNESDDIEDDQEIIDLTYDEMIELKEEYEELGYDEDQIEAYLTLPEDRTPRQHEIVTEMLHPDYIPQVSYIADSGEYFEVPYGTSGSQRPDLVKLDEGHLSMLEAKCYTDVDNLIHNMKEQTALREEGFEENLNDITYIISPNFTIEDADKIATAMADSKADIEWIYR